MTGRNWKNTCFSTFQEKVLAAKLQDLKMTGGIGEKCQVSISFYKFLIE